MSGWRGRSTAAAKGLRAFDPPRLVGLLRLLGSSWSIMMTSELSPSSMRSSRFSVLMTLVLPFLGLGGAPVLSCVRDRVAYKREDAVPLFDSSPELEDLTSEAASRALPLPFLPEAERGRAEVDAVDFFSSLRIVSL